MTIGGVYTPRLRTAPATRQARSGAGRRAAIVEKAVQDWRGAALQRGGLDRHEIADTLREEVAYAALAPH